jgi:hypothetical protein
MVMMLVRCNGCGKSGEFDIHLEFQAKRDRCTKCTHDSTHPWRFTFCILPCFIDWMKKKNVAELGFPCQDCINMETGEASGFFCGFKQNGICKTCNGNKSVVGRFISEDPWAEKKK